LKRTKKKIFKKPENKKMEITTNEQHDNNNGGKIYDERIIQKQSKRRLKHLKNELKNKTHNNFFNDDNDDTSNNTGNQSYKQISKQNKPSSNNKKNILVINQKYNSNLNGSKKNYCNNSNNQKQQTQTLTMQEIMFQQANENVNEEAIFESSTSNDDKLMQHILLESLNQGTQLINQNADNNHENTIANKDELEDDYSIALFLQQEETENYQKLLTKTNSNCKHNKVNTIHSTFQNNYYDIDDDIMNDSNFNENENENNSDNIATVEDAENCASNHVATSGTVLKHDSKIWNKKYVQRLNRYDIFGNLNDKENHFNSQSYNSLRNSLDKKGFKNYEAALI
jgi:hypothetical protein